MKIKLLFPLWYPQILVVGTFKDTCNQPLVTNLRTTEKHNALAFSWTRLSLLRKKRLIHLSRAQVHLALQVKLTISPSRTLHPALHYPLKIKVGHRWPLNVSMITTIFSMRLSFSPVKNDSNYFCCFYKNSSEVLECLKFSLFCCCSLNTPVLPGIFYVTRHIYVWWDKCTLVRLGSPIHYPAFQKHSSSSSTTAVLPLKTASTGDLVFLPIYYFNRLHS